MKWQIKLSGGLFMNEKLLINYVSLLLTILMIFFMGIIYFLLGKSMIFSLKIGFGVIALVILILIGFNIFTIIKKSNMKETKQ
jgi:hypothetical protein